jgi:hypothetical protein
MRILSTCLVALMLVVGCQRSPSPNDYQNSEGANPALEQLVAPIALYPDPLVAQVLPASTNPMEIVSAADALAGGGRPSQSTASQWDPSVQALLSFPTVLKMMSDRIDWTTRLGQAFSSDEGSVLAAIQQVRREAKSAGNLQSNAQQVISTRGSAIIVEPADPAYIYVPQYNPVAILSPAPYYDYAPLMTFGVGFAAGAATAYACSWGGGSVVVNNNYHYNYSNSYPPYTHYGSNTGAYGTYHPKSATYTGYNPRTGTYGAYNPHTGNYGTYDPSTGAYTHDGTSGTFHPSDDSFHGYGSTSAWGDHSSWGSAGGYGADAFRGLDGGGWGARDASARGFDSMGGGGWDRGGGAWGGGGDFGAFRGGFRGGGFGGFRGGGFGGFRGGGFGGRR